MKFILTILISLLTLSSANAIEAQEKNSIIKLEHTAEGITLYNRAGFKAFIINELGLNYYSYAYTNGPETGRRMKTYQLESVALKETIIYYSSIASKDCPFIIWKSIYGQIKSTEKSKCLP